MNNKSEKSIPQTPALDNNDTHIEDINNDHSFEIKLSVSTKVVHSKVEGGAVKTFEVYTLNCHQENTFKIIFTTKNYSTNVWNANRHSNNYIGMTGVALDFDGG
jgi:hypothetical protein